MGKFDGVLFATDYDDTLVTKTGRLPEENRLAAEYFTQNGGIFTVATGRAVSTFGPHFGELPINAPVVLSNGAMIYDFRTKAVVFDSELPARAKADLVALLRVVPELGVETYRGEEIYVHNPNEVTWNHLRKVGTPYELCPPENMPTPWVKVLMEQDVEPLARAEKFLIDNFGEHYEIVYSNKYLLEMTRKGCNKGAAVLEVARLMGISREHIYCAGDNRNDLPMLRAAKIGFAPENCADPVKESGARLVSHCERHTIKDAIDILDKLY